MQNLQSPMDKGGVGSGPCRALIVGVERLERKPRDTATLVLRREFTGERLTAQVYAALNGCSLATAREAVAVLQAAPVVRLDASDVDVAGSELDRPGADSSRKVQPFEDRNPVTATPGRELRYPEIRWNGARPAAIGAVPGADPSAFRRKPLCRLRAKAARERGDAALDVSRRRARDIIAAVSEAWNIEPNWLRARTRVHSVVRPRHAAMATIVRLCPDLPLLEIGAMLGGYGHTVVSHACRTHAHLLATDPTYAVALAAVERQMQPNHQPRTRHRSISANGEEVGDEAPNDQKLRRCFDVRPIGQ